MASNNMNKFKNQFLFILFLATWIYISIVFGLFMSTDKWHWNIFQSTALGDAITFIGSEIGVIVIVLLFQKTKPDYKNRLLFTLLFAAWIYLSFVIQLLTSTGEWHWNIFQSTTTTDFVNFGGTAIALVILVILLQRKTDARNFD